MFDAQDNRFGLVASRRRGGGLTVARVAWWSYRWSMIQFAKFVLVEFGYAPRTEEVEEVVDAWFAPPPSPPHRKIGDGEGRSSPI